MDVRWTRITLLIVLNWQNTFGATVKPNQFHVTHQKWSTLDGMPTKLIAHRGEKVLMPEHTLAAYEIASIENADFVEPDLVLTKDEYLICFHDLTLKNGTNIDSILELAYLQNKTVDGDWFIPDLTLAQLKMVKIEQVVVGIRPQYFNDLLQIPTFEEYLELIHKMQYKLSKSIGIIPELKSPELVNARLGKQNFMEKKILEVLRHYGYPLKKTDSQTCSTEKVAIPCPFVIIQCFNKDSLKYLRQQTDLELMMLVENDPNLLTLNALKELSSFVNHYGVWKELLYSGIKAVLKYDGIEYNSTQIAAAGGFIPTENFTNLVHLNRMQMSIYTIYDSRERSLRGCSVECVGQNKTEELFYYFNLGVDSMFVENVPEAIQLKMEYESLQVKLVSDSNNGVATMRLERCLALFTLLFSKLLYKLVC